MDQSFEPGGRVAAEGTIVFRPRHASRSVLCVLLLVVGSLLIVFAANGHGTPPALFKASIYGALCLALGLLLVGSLIRGVPKLIMDEGGVTRLGLFRRRTTSWADIGLLTMVNAGFGWRSRSQIRAPIPARIRLPGVARSSLVISDVYRTPLAEITFELQKRQAVALGLQAPEQPPIPQPAFQPGGPRHPWLTVALLAVLVAVFALEQRMAVAPPRGAMAPDLSTLVALGGLSRDLAASGQWWRVLTAPYLHANLAHLLGNGVVMFFAGYLLERYAGRAWMLCVFVLGAVAGSAGSLAINAPGTVTVGASGAIMAMVAALFVMSFHLPSGPAKSRMQMGALRVGIPSLIPFSHTVGGLHVDYGAHGGGAIMGAVLGVLMLVAWRHGRPLPGYRRYVTALAGAGLMACLWGASRVAIAYPTYAEIGPLIPATELRNSGSAIARGPELLQRFPGDPRSPYFAGLAASRAGDRAGAERLLTQAITMAEAQMWRVRSNLANEFRGTFASVLLDEGRADEAKALARPVCTATGRKAVDPAIINALRRYHLCDESP